MRTDWVPPPSEAVPEKMDSEDTVSGPILRPSTLSISADDSLDKSANNTLSFVFSQPAKLFTVNVCRVVSLKSFSTSGFKFQNSRILRPQGGSDQDFEAKNFMGHSKPNFWGKHDGTHKKRPTACVLMKNEVNWFHEFYTSPLMTFILRLMIGDTAKFLLQIHPKRCELWSHCSDLWSQGFNEVENVVDCKN